MSHNYREVTSVTHLVDSDTGEVLSTQEKTLQVSSKKVSPREFVKVYLNDYRHLLNLRGLELRFINCLFSYIGYDTNAYLFFKDDKEKMAKDMDVTVQTIANLNNSLTKKGIVVQTARGKYMFNPKYVFKGDELKHNSTVMVFSSYSIIDPFEKEIEDLAASPKLNS